MRTLGYILFALLLCMMWGITAASLSLAPALTLLLCLLGGGAIGFVVVDMFYRLD